MPEDASGHPPPPPVPGPQDGHCGKCGTAIPSYASYCPGCGAPAPRLRVEIRRPGLVTFIAILHFISAPFLLIAAIALFAFGLEGDEAAFSLGMGALLLVIGLIQIATGVGLFRLREWGRIMQIVLSGIGLLAFPVGTIINGLLIYYFTRPGIRVVFSGKTPDALSADERAWVARLNESSAATVVISVLIVGFVAVAYVGIVAAIAIPNLLTAMQRSKQKRTMADIRSVAIATEAYATDHNRYPTVETFADLQPILSPTYIRVLPQADGWGTPFEYTCWPSVEGGECVSYAFVSGGRDQVLEGKALDEYGGPTTHFDCDIVYADGSFVQYPEGIQTR